jgi:hypothetical protein
MFCQNPEIVWDRCRWKSFARWRKVLPFVRWCPPLYNMVFGLIRLEANMRYALLT